MGKLILVRHGHTTLNGFGDDDRIRAWLDVPLDDQGLREASELAERLAGFQIGVIHCSDLRRARQTADVLQRSTKAPILDTMELRPWDLGVFAGQKVSEILPLLSFLTEHPDLVAPSGESFNQFLARYSRRLGSLLHLAATTGNCVVAVTHLRNILASHMIINGRERSYAVLAPGPETGSVSIIETNGLQGLPRAEDEKPFFPAA